MGVEIGGLGWDLGLGLGEASTGDVGGGGEREKWGRVKGGEVREGERGRRKREKDGDDR